MWSPSTNSCFLTMWRSRNRNTFITVVMLGLSILCFLLSYNVFAMTSPESDSLSSLVNVQIVFRHGERNPTSFYKDDPYKYAELWPEGFGQLTNIGKRQLYEVGLNIRKQYSGWLPEDYSASDLKVRSSYADRCQMSAQVLLAGLYPPHGKQIWNEGLPWQPIPINSVPRKDDNVIVVGKKCDKYSALRKSIEGSMNKNLSENQSDLLKYLTLHSGEPMETVARIEDLYFTLTIERERGLKIPKWATTVYPSQLEPIAHLMEASLSWNEEAKAFATGGLLKVMTDSMSDAKDGKGVKMALYSGHDITLLSLARVLSGAGEAPPSHLPGYGASVVLELHKIAQSYYIRVIYFINGMTLGSEGTVLDIPGCGDMCPWDQFMKFVQQYMNVIWDKDCDVPV